MAAPAHAGNYILTYGKQFKVCRDGAANLKSFGDLPLGLMEWPINPALKLFKKPKWRAVAPQQSIPLIETWVRQVLLGPFKYSESYIEKKKKEISLSIEKGEGLVENATFDIDNNGVTENVYRIRLSYLHYKEAPNVNACINFFTNKDGTSIIDPSDDATIGRPADFTIHDGRIFLIRISWPSYDGSGFPKMMIYELSSSQNAAFAITPVCHFRYESRKTP